MNLSRHAQSDGEWLSSTSKATEIGRRAIAADARAAIRIDAQTPDCRLAWNTHAGIADIESRHDAYGCVEVAGGSICSSAMVLSPPVTR